MPLREDIKALIIKSGWTMRKVVDELNRKYDRNDKVQNLSAKLKRGTIKFREVEEILDVIGYHVEFIKGKASE
jgi:hypothetical protein